eukprot:TRINITY_DN7507_c0_g1_i3.p1 TRINITY_DN7507_c0_g1~~TRINITY_DN7507_c0_g1_i3.p1  ORF type:complete len:164 (+),score=17.52 TRINITY_DN7507_c0_g1_i3:23-514(+)
MALYTQLCIRPVPCKILEGEFLDILHDQGLDVFRYRVYFPKRIGPRGRKINFGYGFVTCQRDADAEAFRRTFQGFHFDHVESTKRLLVELAHEKDEDEMRRFMTRSLGRSFSILRRERVRAEVVPLPHLQGNVSERSEYIEQDIGNSSNRVPDPSDVPLTRLS